jgi:tape measure domain-containing protein
MTEQIKTVLTAEDRTRAAFQSAQANIRGMSTALNQIRAAGAAVFGAQLIGDLKAAGAAVIDARVQVEKLQTVLKQAVGAANVAQELTFVRDSAARLGLEFQSTAQSYAKFAAASRGTALEGQQTREIFNGIAQASAALGLSSEETAGALTAVQQIISKGKVSAEELRGQLGERLPGAFQIAARSIGVTTQELDRLLVTGSLLADDFLPKFAQQLQTEFADTASKAAEQTQGALNRLSTAYGDFKSVIARSPVGDAAVAGINSFAKDLQSFSDRARDADASAKNLFDRLSGFALPVSVPGLLLSLRANSLAGETRSLAQSDAITARIGRDNPAAPPRLTASSVRGIDNAQLAAQTDAANAELRKLLQTLRKPGDKLQAEIADLRRLGAITGTDVTEAIAEARRRAAGSGRVAAEASNSVAESLVRELYASQNLSAEQRAALDVRLKQIKLTEDQAGALARLVDQQTDQQRLTDNRARVALEAIAAQEEAERAGAQAGEQAVRRQADEVERLVQQWTDTIDPMARYQRALDAINSNELLTPEQREIGRQATVTALLGPLDQVEEETKKANDVARDLGLTFSSAFEDAILNGESLRDVLKGIAQDVAKIFIRKGVTEPAADFLAGAAGNLLSGFGGLLTGGGSPELLNGSIAGKAAGSFGGVSAAGLVSTKSASIVQNITVGQQTGRAEAFALGQAVKADTIRALRESEARGA